MDGAPGADTEEASASELASLRRRFAGADFITFDAVNGMVRAHVATEAATATIFLQGAHLTAWQPTGEAPAIFFSRKSEIAPGKPLRGGIPVAFPWFANDKKSDRIDGHPGPSHGFARLQEWTLQSAERKETAAELTFTLGPSAMSRSMGFDHFALTLVFTIDRKLGAKFMVKNTGSAALMFEEALHTYYQITDIHEVSVSGLEDTGFIDKTDNFLRKPAERMPLRFVQTTDRIYENTTAACVIRDATVGRRITVSKKGSHSTVVWNPFHEMPDIGPWDWHEFVAVETANVESNAIILAPGAGSTMELSVEVAKIAG